MPRGTVFHTAPWVDGLERMPGGQFSGKHLMLLDIAERWHRLHPLETIENLAHFSGMPRDLLVSSLVLLMMLGRIDSLNVIECELALFDLEAIHPIPGASSVGKEP